MEWKDLSDTTACVLERLWGLYDDKPRTRRISIGETFKVWEKEYTFTEENYAEMIKYIEDRKDIRIKRIDDLIIVSGVGLFGSMN